MEIPGGEEGGVGETREGGKRQSGSSTWGSTGAECRSQGDPIPPSSVS